MIYIYMFDYLRVTKLCSELLLAEWYGVRCNFWDRDGRKQRSPRNCTV